MRRSPPTVARTGSSESTTTTSAIGDDPKAAGERRDAPRALPHDPVMKARTASAPATSVVTANQRSRFGPTPGA